MDQTCSRVLMQKDQIQQCMRCFCLFAKSRNLLVLNCDSPYEALSMHPLPRSSKVYRIHQDREQTLQQQFRVFALPAAFD
jgi:hypothetical protein